MTEPARLDLYDMQQILALIDLVSSRGAIKGVELATAGNLYNKIAAFIQAAQAQTTETEGTK